MKLSDPKIQYALLTAAAIATGVVNAVETTAVRGALAGAFVFALASLLYFGRERFDVINVMSGTGDERTRTLYTRATAFTGNVLIAVVAVWWVVSGIVGEVNETLTILAAVGAGAFIVGAYVESRRG